MSLVKLLLSVVSLLWAFHSKGCNRENLDIIFVEGAPNWRLTQSNNHANISELLDNLLRGYDNSIRPGFGGPPAVVEVDIMVRSMGPISEVDMTYSMDCYFRQSWVDKRLAFKGAQDTLALSISMLARIWKPDTYFYNGKQSYLHTITTPNKFVRLYQDGRVLYSSRLTIKAGCPMNLEDFPMDIQRCPLKFGSFGYTTTDVIYRWNRARQAVVIAEDMKLSQFDLVDCPSGNITDNVYKTSPEGRRDADAQFTLGHDTSNHRRSKISNGVNRFKEKSSQYSMLLVHFHLQRHMGNFLIQVYGPCCLLVVLSWVSFWLNREATADRVSLGITTVLTMTFLGLEARTDLPKVPYPTALDFFVFLSFAFIFATIIQFALVHYFTKYGSGESYFIVDDCDSDSSGSDADTLNIRKRSKRQQRIQHQNLLIHQGREIGSQRDHEELLEIASGDSIELERQTVDPREMFEVIPLSMCSISSASHSRDSLAKKELKQKKSWVEWDCFKRKENSYAASGRERGTLNSSQRRLSILQSHPTVEQYARRRKREPQMNSVSKIDRASRVAFPILFFIINVIYWAAYLSRSERWSPTSAPDS